ncbi:hypothetical protein BDY24DRAFT_382182 [Mrakia frigida]|uniref:uncharacterized protein n=1 Tax=Mrakia frigida TaxID=29902 RepID=UPI003FCC2171
MTDLTGRNRNPRVALGIDPGSDGEDEEGFAGERVDEASGGPDEKERRRPQLESALEERQRVCESAGSPETKGQEFSGRGVFS